MEIIIDGAPFSGEVKGENLQDILSDLAAQVLGPDKALKEVKVNGQPYEEASMGKATAYPRARIQRLEVDSIPARDLALHFLSNAGEYLRTISESSVKVAELFRVADEQEASEHYLRTLDSLHLFLQVVQSTRVALGLDFDRISSEGISAEERLNRLLGLVQEMLSAQEKQDWVLLADILQYDLKTELEAWRRLMPVVREAALS